MNVVPRTMHTNGGFDSQKICIVNAFISFINIFEENTITERLEKAYYRLTDWFAV